ncbi:MAG TPA: YIP1 family protein, partial [Caldimonas sp.]
MNCPACHTPNPDNSRFCTHCGTVLAAAAASAAYAKPAYAPPAAAPPAYAPPAYAPPPAFASAPAFAPPPGAAAAPTMAGDTSGLIQRILNITLKPKSEWPVIAAEPPSLARILVGCVIPLAAIQSVLGFIHRVVIGVSVPFIGNVRMPVASGLAVAVMGFVFALIGMFVLALIVNAWAPFFAARRNLAESLKVAAYAAVPGWLGSFFGILPVLGVLVGLLAGLYAIYVLYLGLPVVMRGPKEKALGYTVAVILTGIVCGVVLGALGAAVGGFSHFGAMRPSAEARAEEGAAITGNVLGSLLGTDDKGKAALGAALGGLARAGQEAERAERAAAAAAPQPTPAEAAARAQRDAVQVGNVIGGMLGTDPQGRAALGAALGNLARTGQQVPGAPGTPAADAALASAQSGNGAAVDPANAGAAVGGLLNALGGALGGSRR